MKQHAKMDMTKALGDGMLAVLRGLTACVGQDELKFEQAIGQGGSVFLGTVLDKYKFVTVNLERNVIGAAGAASLSAALPGCAALQTLDLHFNDIGDSGAASLSAALPGCAALQTLDLGSNRIGAAGAASLSAALPGCAALQTLILQYNGIGKERSPANLTLRYQSNNLQYSTCT